MLDRLAETKKRLVTLLETAFKLSAKFIAVGKIVAMKKPKPRMAIQSAIFESGQNIKRDREINDPDSVIHNMFVTDIHLEKTTFTKRAIVKVPQKAEVR